MKRGAVIAFCPWQGDLVHRWSQKTTTPAPRRIVTVPAKSDDDVVPLPMGHWTDIDHRHLHTLGNGAFGWRPTGTPTSGLTCRTCCGSPYRFSARSG